MINQFNQLLKTHILEKVKNNEPIQKIIKKVKKDEDLQRNLALSVILGIFALGYGFLYIMSKYPMLEKIFKNSIYLTVLILGLYCLYRAYKYVNIIEEKLLHHTKSVAFILNIVIGAGLVCVTFTALAAFFPIGIAIGYVAYKHFKKITIVLDNDIAIKALIKQIALNIYMIPLYIITVTLDRDMDLGNIFIALLVNVAFVIYHNDTGLHKIWLTVISFGLASLWIFGKSAIRTEFANNDTIDTTTVSDTSIACAPDAMATIESFDNTAIVGTDIYPSDISNNVTTLTDNNSLDISNTDYNIGAANIISPPSPIDNSTIIPTDTVNAADNNLDNGITFCTPSGTNLVTFQDNKIIDHTGITEGTYEVNMATGNVDYQNMAGETLASVDPNTHKVYDAQGNFMGESTDLGAITSYTDAEGNHAIRINLDGAPIVEDKTGTPIVTIKKR